MKTFINFIRRNRLYTAINLLGLALSTAFILLLAVYVQKQLSTDSFQEKADRIMLIANDNYASAYHLKDYLTERYPEIESATALHNDSYEFQVNDEPIYATVNFVDSSFFSIFSFRIREGDAESFRHSDRNVMVSESFASLYFSDREPVGSTITLFDHELTITGVMEDIDNSVIPYCDILLRGEWLERSNPSHDKHLSNSGGVQTFVLVRENADLMAKKADMLEYFQEVWWVYKAGCKKITMLPLRDIYFCGREHVESLNTGSRTIVHLLLTVCIVLLLFAVLNYINLTTAIAGFRAKEMASRRLLGASKADIFFKMTGESTIMCIAATVAAIFIAEGLSPYVSGFLDYNFSIFGAVSMSNVAILVIYVLLLGTLSGIVPATMLMSVKPIDIVRGSFRVRTKTTYSKIIMIVQNMLTMCMLVTAIMMSVQIRYMLNAPLGYRTKDILNIENRYGNASQLNVAKDRLLSETFVKDVGYGRGTPLGGTNNSTVQMLNGDWISFQEIFGDDGYFRILGIKEKENRNNPGCLWVNEYAMTKISAINEKLGISDTESVIPVDKRFGQEDYSIGGIYYDFKIRPLLQAQSAALIQNYGTYKEDQYPWNILVEVEGDHRDAYQRIKEIFEDVFHYTLFEAEYIEDQIGSTFSKEKKTLEIVTVFTVISIIISALGLLAMSTYYTLQQRKGTAVKRVLGAGRNTILKELVMSFMKYVSIAILLGIPAGWYLAGRWLEGFSYRTGLHWWIFVLSAAIIFIIAAASVMWQSMKASDADPADALKEE